MREEIVISWFRSALAGVRFDCLEAPYDPDPEADGRLMSAALPVMDEIAGDLVGTKFGILLADARGQILERRVSDPRVRSCFDRVGLAPGCRYGEDDVGTNAIGTALALRRPFAVVGGEHFVDALAVMACAAAPVVDPLSGAVIGVLDFTCRTPHASPLMMPFAARAGREIQQRLLDGGCPAERMLRDDFLRARRRSRGAIVSVGADTILANAVATGMLRSGDHELLWEWLSGPSRRQSLPAEIALTGGTSVVIVSVEPCRAGDRFIGATLRLEPPPAEPGAAPAGRPALGWAGLTATERRIAELVAEGMTNRQVASHTYLSPHTVDAHLRQVFRKLEIASRVELTRVVIEQAADQRRA
jgi:DNA-binding CsgD family transcriptional regulator